MAGQRTHGTGGVFRRKKNGKYLPNWYIAYYNRNGRQQQESTRQPLKAVAERELRKKLDDVERGVPVEQSRKLRYENIRKSLITEYKNNHVGLVERRNGKIHGLDYLDEFFANILVKNITSPLLREFIAKLQSGELQRIVRENNPKEKRAVKPMGNGTINRVLALLRKAMNIARKDALIHAVPYFPMLCEDNVRTAFVETVQFKTILSHLPEHLHPLMIFLYRTGCRVGAALQITWEMVSGDATTMMLPAKIVKNKEPITLALTAELTAVLKKQFRQTGQPVFDATNLRREWASATAAAKCPELLIHDLRRSDARNLVNAGVPETVAMKIGGWKTRSVFIRYAIVATKDIQNAMNALEKNDGTLMEPDAKLAQR